MTSDATHDWPDDSEARRLVEAVAEAPSLLVALDFDGTLAPRVDDPMSARMTPAARAAVDRLVVTPGVEVALVSGRSIVDLEIISERPTDSAIHLSGSHGSEYLFAGGELEGAPTAPEIELRDRLRERAEAATAEIPGIWIEPKTLGFGVHTRVATAADADRAYTLTDEIVGEYLDHAADDAPRWRRRTGHDLVEYAFRDTGKDRAIAVVRERRHPDAIVFAGDDTTDEDGLAVLTPADLGIRVGPGDTHARVRVTDPDALAALLVAIADARLAAGVPS